MMEKLYILLPVHNRKEVTRQVIQCLKSQTCQQFHLILIDDGSADGTEEMVRSELSALTVIKGKGDWWWAGSLQQGYLWLKKQNMIGNNLALILNDDTRFEKDFLEKGVSLFKGRKRVLILAHCYSKNTGKLIDAGIHVDWCRMKFAQASNPGEINCLSTRGLFLRVEDLLNLRGFHSILLPHYASDYEFTMRAYRNGLTLKTDSSLRLWMDENTTGYHQFEEKSFRVFLHKYFSKKSASNPLIWTSLIALSCPWQWKFLNWFRIWRNSADFLLKSFLKLPL